MQQTQVFNPNDVPPHNYVRWYVTPDPGTAFHIYGVLWTPSIVSYYIDRQPTSPAYPNAANGPANPLLILQVYTTGGGCSPTALATPPPSYPAPTPHPGRTAVPGAPAIAQKTGVVNYPSAASFAATFAHAPPNGDVLLAILVAGSPIAAPPGFGQISGPSAVVGRAFGDRAAQPWNVALDLGRLQRDATAGFAGILEQLKPGQLEMPITYSLNNPKATGGSISLRVSQTLGDPFSEPQPYIAAGTSVVFGDWAFDGDVVWISPS